MSRSAPGIDPVWATTSQAMAYLNIGKRQLLAQVSAGLLSREKVGKQAYRYPWAELRSFPDRLREHNRRHAMAGLTGSDNARAALIAEARKIFGGRVPGLREEGAAR